VTVVHELVAEQARLRPTAPAVSLGDETLTYAELDELAERLAERLRRLGAGPETVVGVHLPRTPSLVAAALGILKAGSAYTPLQVGYPTERLAQILGLSGTSIVVSSRRVADALPPTVQTLLEVEAPFEPAAGSNVAVRPENLAYVLYTSGSTGLPKGVAVPHRAVAAYASAPGLELAPGMRVLQLAPLAFDASTFEIWSTLVHGGECVLFPPELDAASDLGPFLERVPLDVLNVTNSLFNLLVDERPDAFDRLSWVVTGAEPASAAHLRRFQAAHPRVRFLHTYGPTETTTFATAVEIDWQLAPDASSVPLGQALPNTEVHLLRDDLAPASSGETAEIYIGGVQLARGYLGRPDLTAERFVPDQRGHGERLYRTGDLARLREDGSLEFVGRRDAQVKIRGARVELGDVEAAVMAHDDVADCAASARPEPDGGHRLVAYVSSRSGRVIDTGSVRETVAARLPDFLVPSEVVQLRAMPRADNGKLDRARLADCEPWSTSETPAPRNGAEERLAALWMELLDVESVGRDDNFFAIGGHSLAAVRLASRIADAFDVELTARAVYEAQTLERLAERVAQLRVS
jgi:amino acid adenylation domain-containing protein